MPGCKKWFDGAALRPHDHPVKSYIITDPQNKNRCKEYTPYNKDFGCLDAIYSAEAAAPGFTAKVSEAIKAGEKCGTISGIAWRAA